jgi:protein TonB
MINLFNNKMEFDDIIFESRNKDYGAYPIRRGYNFNVVVSILVATLLVSLLILFPYLKALNKNRDKTLEIRPRYVEMKMEKMEPPREDLFFPPAPDPPPPNTQANIEYVAPVVVDTLQPNEKQLPTVADVQASNPTTDQLTVSGTGGYDELLTGQEGVESDEPFIIVEVTPAFKGGGFEKFRDWVQKRTNYPQIAQDNGIQGTVRLTFVVERDGSVTNVKVVKSVNKILDDEAVKAIESSPKWAPGLQMGKPVRVRFYIPLVFSFNR